MDFFRGKIIFPSYSTSSLPFKESRLVIKKHLFTKTLKTRIFERFYIPLIDHSIRRVRSYDFAHSKTPLSSHKILSPAKCASNQVRRRRVASKTNHWRQQVVLKWNTLWHATNYKPPQRATLDSSATKCPRMHVPIWPAFCGEGKSILVLILWARLERDGFFCKNESLSGL